VVAQLQITNLSHAAWTSSLLTSRGPFDLAIHKLDPATSSGMQLQ
jgi:hypothetical protein